MPTRARKFTMLRGTYEAQALSLKKQTRFASEREERQTYGRIQTLKRVATELSAIDESTKPARVQAVIEGVLALLAEHKATWIVNYIRERRRCGINELGEWTAEGAMSQIDEIALELCARLSPDWNLSSFIERQGQYFHVYHRLETNPMDAEVGGKHWCSPEREQWYKDVAIIRVEQAGDQLGQVFRLTNHSNQGGESNRKVFWRAKDAPHRPTGAGDIIVSVLFGTAWMVDDAGFQVIDQKGE